MWRRSGRPFSMFKKFSLCHEAICYISSLFPYGGEKKQSALFPGMRLLFKNVRGVVLVAAVRTAVPGTVLHFDVPQTIGRRTSLIVWYRETINAFISSALHTVSISIIISFFPLVNHHSVIFLAGFICLNFSSTTTSFSRVVKSSVIWLIFPFKQANSEKEPWHPFISPEVLCDWFWFPQVPKATFKEAEQLYWHPRTNQWSPPTLLVSHI